MIPDYTALLAACAPQKTTQQHRMSMRKVSPALSSHEGNDVLSQRFRTTCTGHNFGWKGAGNFHQGVSDHAMHAGNAVWEIIRPGVCCPVPDQSAPTGCQASTLHRPGMYCAWTMTVVTGQQGMAGLQSTDAHCGLPEKHMLSIDSTRTYISQYRPPGPS